MHTVGIIAEYNPFHTGHEYQLAKAKELSGADYAVVVMSPDFVQRGEPAIFDKYVRAEMALRCGADLVLELPVCYASGSAEYFAEGAVRMLGGLGVVDTLCFGAEQADLCRFKETAQVLLAEPQNYKDALQGGLRQGLTFPQARAAALRRIPAQRESAQAEDHFLSSPNNILGVEYCKALYKFRFPITPLPLERVGSSYASRSLEGPYCSASALRNALSDGSLFSWHAAKSPEDSAMHRICFYPGSLQSSLDAYIPKNICDLFRNACKSPVFPDDLLPHLIHKLLASEHYADILDISPELSDRIRNLRYRCVGKSFSEIVALLKTRQITEARIRRALLHLILEIRTENLSLYREAGTVFYAHVLGFRRNAAPLLHEIKKRSALPFITKASCASSLLSRTGLRMWKQDTAASHLYRSLLTEHYGMPFRTEYEISPVIL